MKEVSQLRRSSAIDQLLLKGWLADVEWYSEIDSTNNALKSRLNSGLPLTLPRLAVADRQTAGRGRGQNVWWSPEGCLMFSLAWRPTPWSVANGFDVFSRITQLPLVVGISIAEALKDSLMNRRSIQVKWPNDVYIGNKKLGGILIESVVGADEPLWIIGAGVNVLVDIPNAPEPIRSNATSLHLECTSEAQEELCLESILVNLVDKLQATIDQWTSQKDFLRDVWPTHCMLSKRRIVIQQADRNIQGICCGIDDRGALLVRDQLGQLHSVVSGVVQAW